VNGADGRASSVSVPLEIWARCLVSGPQYGITPSLLAALAWRESSFDPFAWNPEPKYPYLVDARSGKPFRKLRDAEALSAIPPSDFHALAGDPDQEWNAQRASWGACQVMGALARELGFRRPYLTELVRIDVNLDLAARDLARQIARFGSAAEGLSAYNAGTPTSKNRTEYVIPILRVADAIRDQKGGAA
jgi:hypothetical protein